MLIDISMPITKGSVFRLGTPVVDISSHKFYHESEGEYESVMLSLSAHTATHVDLVYQDKRIEPERMIGNGKLIDVTQVPGQEIQLNHVESQIEVERGDFVFFRTDRSKYVDTEKYYHHPELSLEIIEWLILKKVNAVGIDALGLGLDRRHGEYDRMLIGNDIYVIENLANLSAIPQNRFKTYCFPLKIYNIDAIPARVIIEIEKGG